MELAFPSCWNSSAGPNPEGYKKHMAYPTAVLAGTCPEGFDTRLPTLFYEINFYTQAFTGQAGQYVLSNGDPTGFGAHADFIFGWEGDTLAGAMKACNGNATGQPGADGTLQGCSFFNTTLQDAAVASSCTFSTPAALATETCTTACTALPGNVLVQYGPGPASDATATGLQSVGTVGVGGTVPITTGTPVGANVVSSVTQTPSSNFELGQVFAQKASSTTLSTLSSSPLSTPVPVPISTNTTTPTPILTAISSLIISPSPTTFSALAGVNGLASVVGGAGSAQSEIIFSTSSYTQGQKAYEIVYIEEFVTVTADVVSTVIAASTVEVVKRDMRRHIHKHGRRMPRF